jgi:ABC-type arginine/histidine transport system permease subunit
LNSAGYLAEIISGAMRGVPRGEMEAAAAAGFSRWGTFRHIVAPNAVRLALRAYGNEVIFVVKGTSVASLVTIVELMGAARAAYFQTYDPITPLLLAGAFYLTIVWSIAGAIRAMEHRLVPELRVMPRRSSFSFSKSTGQRTRAAR